MQIFKPNAERRTGGKATSKEEKSLHQTLPRGIFIAAAFSISAACTSDNATSSVEGNGIGDPATGFAYARANCAECHALDAGQAQSPNPAAPAFDSLANRRDMTRMTLSALLRSPHRSMPNLLVEPDRIDDLSAYLATLSRN